MTDTGVHSIEACTLPGKTRGNKNHAYFHESKGKDRLSYLSIVLYSPALTFYFLACYARLLAFYLQACNVTLQTTVIFSCIFGVIVPDSQLSKCTKPRLKSHKIVYKTSKQFSAGEITMLPKPPGQLGTG